MFGLFGGPQGRPARTFNSAFKTALRSPDASERLAAAEAALEIATQLEPWPFSNPPKRLAIGQLHGVLGQAYWELMRHDPARFSRLAIECCEKAAGYLTREDGEVWAILLMNTALVYADRPQGDPGENIEKAIGLLEEAVSVVDLKLHRDTWIASMMNLAVCYGQRTGGDRAENIERSIQAQEAVLAVLSKRREPIQRATVLAGLGTAYRDRQKADRAENLETAIRYLEEALTVLSPEHTPFEWAGVQMNLSTVYSARVRGQRAENFERAIKANDLALTVFTRDDTPADWAAAQLNRGGLFAERPTGDPMQNSEEAVRAFEKALSVFSPDEFPHQYAGAMQNLALAKSGRIAGSKRENVKSSIEDARVAAAAINKDTMPLAWAQAQIALGNALAETRDGNRGECIEESLTLYQAALTVLTPTSEPEDWAITMGHLANALAERVKGDRADNLERAIEIQEEALRFIDQSVSPRSWGGAMQNLAVSYGIRVAGVRADNVEKKIALIETALVLISERNYPHQRSGLLELLGDGFVNRVRGDRLDNLDRALQAFDAAARTRNRDENPEAWLRLRQKRLEALLNRDAAGGNKGERGGPREEAETAAPAPSDGGKYISNLLDDIKAVSPDDHPRTWAAAQINIGDMYIRNAPSGAGDGLAALIGGAKSNTFKAVEAYEAALSVTSRVNDPATWASIMRSIARAYTLLHMYAEFQEVGPDGLEKRGLLNLERGDEESTRHLDAAIAALKASLEVSDPESEPRTHLDSSLHLGELQVWRRDWVAAEAAFVSAGKAADQILAAVELSDSEMKDTLKALGKLATLAPFASLVLGRVERALELIETGRGRLLAKALTLEALPLPAETRSRLQDLQKQVLAQEQRLVSPRLFYRSGPLEESIRLRNLIREIVTQVDVEAAARREDAPDLMAELVADGSVVVIPVLTYFGGKIIIGLTRDGALEIHVADSGAEAELTLSSIFRSRIGDLSGGWLNNYLAYKDEELSDEDWTATLEAASLALGDVFAGPLVRALESLGVKPGARLNILPQGPLGLLPLAIARDPGSGETLIERYELSLSPSLTALSHARARANAGSKPDTLAVLSNPQKEVKKKNLKCADFEAELAKSWFEPGSSEVLSGAECSLASTLETLRGRSVWHFAAHGKFKRASPLKSEITLANGESLTLEDIFETRGLGAPRLVILSACETGLYDLDELPNEFIGLPGGFLQAGAAGVIATLWPVMDTATALLLGRFYDEYFGARSSPAAALRASQLWLRSASRDELRATIEEWAGAGRVSRQRAADALGELDEESSGREAAPFASPSFWSGFVYYGA